MYIFGSSNAIPSQIHSSATKFDIATSTATATAQTVHMLSIVTLSSYFRRNVYLAKKNQHTRTHTHLVRLSQVYFV